MTCFDWPERTAYNKRIPKAKIYQASGANAALQARFIEQIDRINWANILRPETINLDATAAVAEIHMIQLVCKQPDIDHDILKALDKTIRWPVIFELYHNGRRRMVAAHKRPSEADSAKWVTSGYFSTVWEKDDAPRRLLPVALDLSGLYEALLNACLPDWQQTTPAKTGGLAEAEQAVYVAGPSPVPLHLSGSMQQRVERLEAIAAQEREIERIRVRLRRTQQFNKRMEVNAELREALERLETLKQGSQ